MADEENLDYLNALADDGKGEAEEVEATEEEAEEPIEGEEAGTEGAEATEEGAEEQEPASKTKATEGSEADPAPRRRAESRIQKLANERSQEREARIRAEAERDALLKYRSAAPAPDNTEAVRVRNEKLSLMEPQERAIFLQSERLEQMQNNLLIAELKSEDRADKASYDAKAVVDPRYARHKDAVEKRLSEYRSKGVNPSRQEMFHLILGESLASVKPKKSTREAAAQRVDSTKGKPATGKSNASAVAGKGDSLADIESRLKGKTFSEMFGN